MTTMNNSRYLYIFIFCLFSCFFGFSLHAQQVHRCGTVEYTEYLKSTNPEYATHLEKMEQKRNQSTPQSKKAALDVTLPIVVHIVHNNADGSISGNNISEEQIMSQIDRLTTDFNGTNDDITDVPDVFKPFIAYDTGIKFCLADIDPDGNYTTGITRTYSEKEEFSVNLNDVKLTSQGGVDVWDRCRYINIWVCPKIINIAGDAILGYTQLPGGPSTTDGIVVPHNYFGDDTGTTAQGTGTTVNNYYKGRTLVHEMGHYLGLNHIWGDDDGACSGDDGVSDTPVQGNSTSGCPSTTPESCGTADMYVNFMDYSYDECLLMFSLGQVDRMEETLLQESSRNCLMDAASASCITNCLADYGNINLPENNQVCFRGETLPLIMENTSTNGDFRTAFLISSSFEPFFIVGMSDSSVVDFATLAPNSYGIHPISYDKTSGLLDDIEFGATTINDLQNYIVSNQICADLMDTNFPVFTVMEELTVDFELICQEDAFGNNRGDAMIDATVKGGSGRFSYWDGDSGVADGDLIEHDETFTLRVQDSIGCVAQKIDKVTCAPYDYTAVGYNFLDIQQTLVQDILYIHFHSPSDLPTYLSIYSVTGQLMEFHLIDSREGVNRFDIDTKDYAKGIYIISLDNRNERAQIKFGKFRN